MYHDNGSLEPDNGSFGRFQSIEALLQETSGVPREETADLNALTTPEQPLEMWFTKANLIADLERSIATIERKRDRSEEHLPLTNLRGEIVEDAPFATRGEHTEFLLRQRRQLIRALLAYPDEVVFGTCFFVSEEQINLNG